MSKTLEGCCSHATFCKGCKLYYCADDEIYSCCECYDNLGFCAKCSRLGDPGQWLYLCKLCYKDKVRTKKCAICLRYRRITRHPKPFLHSIKQKSICKSCWLKKKISETISQNLLTLDQTDDQK